MPVVSAVGGLVGGLVSGNAANNAGTTLGKAGTAGAQAIGTAGNQAEGLTLGATGTGVSAINSGIGGVGGAVQSGQAGVSSAVGSGQQGINTAAGQSIGGLNNATNTANTVAGNLLGGQLQNLSPYTNTGTTGTNTLNSLVQQGFTAPTAAQAAATPGEQFQLQQGLQGVEQALGASGGAATGGALKALTQYGQNVASTYYQNAFNNAQSAYNTNLGAASTAASQGLTASGMANQAAQNYGNTFNANTIGNATYAGNTLNSAASQNAGLGLTGATTNSQTGLTGATTQLSGQEAGASLGLQGAEAGGNQNLAGTQAASNMFFQGAQGTAAGQVGQGNALAGGINAVGNAANMFGFNYNNPFSSTSGNVGASLLGF